MIRLERIRKFQFKELISVRNKSSSSDLNLEKLEKDSDSLLIEDEEAKLREKQIEKSRNKSGLNNRDFHILHEINPYPEPWMWHHGTVKYARKTFGRYGMASGVNPSICFPLKEELIDKKEYERVAFPKTIPQMIEDAKQKKKEIEERSRIRQQQIVEKVQKLEQWKQDLYRRIKKKEDEQLAAKAKRERLIEEVRQHFGYVVDPKDQKFQELLDKKEKEEKKAAKEARKKAKQERMIAELEKKSADIKKQTSSSEQPKEEPLKE